MFGIGTISRTLLTTALVAILFSAGGCTDYYQLQSDNRMLSERLQKCNDRNTQLESLHKQLNVQLEENKSLLTEKDERIATLEDDKKNLEDTIGIMRDKTRQIAGKPRIVIRNNALPDTLNKELKAFAASHAHIAQFDETNGMIKLKSDLTFPPGSDRVTSNAAETLKQLAGILNSPEASEFSLYIAGHTDDMPISRPATRQRHPTNWYLSVHRAVGVQKELSSGGLDDSRMCVMGFSKYHPIVPNRPGNRGNRLNRRVELWIVPKGAFLTDETSASPAEVEEKEPAGS